MRKIDMENWLNTIHPNQALLDLAELVNSLIEENGDQNIEILKLQADMKLLKGQIRKVR